MEGVENRADATEEKESDEVPQLLLPPLLLQLLHSQ